MPFWRLYYHLVWATKDREPLITAGIEDNLYAYLVHKAAEMDVYVYAVNGWYDHVHLVVAIPPKHSVAEVVKRLKGASSHHLHVTNLAPSLEWERGYGALSLGEKQRPVAEAYVLNQKTHHAQQTPIAWLERLAEMDEGPTDTGMTVGALPVGVREREPDYDAYGKSPF